jgi:hypothetical protein
LWTKNKEDANCNTPNTIGAGVPSQKVTSVWSSHDETGCRKKLQGQLSCISASQS